MFWLIIEDPQKAPATTPTTAPTNTPDGTEVPTIASAAIPA
jgi:hypothetical protein